MNIYYALSVGWALCEIVIYSHKFMKKKLFSPQFMRRQAQNTNWIAQYKKHR